MSQYPVSLTAPKSSFDCTCPWHSPDPERGRNVGDQYREGTGRYPESWCVECCMELPYRLTARDLARLAPDERRYVSTWIRGVGLDDLADELLGDKDRKGLSYFLRPSKSRSRHQAVAFLWLRVSRWQRFVLQDVTRKAKKNPALM